MKSMAVNHLCNNQTNTDSCTMLSRVFAKDMDIEVYCFLMTLSSLCVWSFMLDLPLDVTIYKHRKKYLKSETHTTAEVECPISHLQLRFSFF